VKKLPDGYGYGGYGGYYGDPYARAHAVGQYRLVGELKLKVQPKRVAELRAVAQRRKSARRLAEGPVRDQPHDADILGPGRVGTRDGELGEPLLGPMRKLDGGSGYGYNGNGYGYGRYPYDLMMVLR